MTECENKELCWNHEQPLRAPMINTADQMIIEPSISLLRFQILRLWAGTRV